MSRPKKNVADAQSPEADADAAAIAPEEILALARRMEELARAVLPIIRTGVSMGERRDMVINSRIYVVHDLEHLLSCAHDETAEREHWLARDDDEDLYATPPNWQHAIDAVEKIRTGSTTSSGNATNAGGPSGGGRSRFIVAEGEAYMRSLPTDRREPPKLPRPGKCKGKRRGS
jgi:hypothetical protein